MHHSFLLCLCRDETGRPGLGVKPVLLVTLLFSVVGTDGIEQIGAGGDVQGVQLGLTAGPQGCCSSKQRNGLRTEGSIWSLSSSGTFTTPCRHLMHTTMPLQSVRSRYQLCFFSGASRNKRCTARALPGARSTELKVQSFRYWQGKKENGKANHVPFRGIFNCFKWCTTYIHHFTSALSPAVQ